MLVLVVQCVEPYEIVVRPTTKYVEDACTHPLWIPRDHLRYTTHVAQGAGDTTRQFLTDHT